MLRHAVTLVATLILLAGCDAAVEVQPVAPPPPPVAAPPDGMCNSEVDCKGEVPTVIGPCPDGQKHAPGGAKWVCMQQRCMAAANCQ